MPRALTPLQIFGILLTVCVLTIFREPLLFLTPRLWAEEGKFYFAHAYGNSFVGSIGYVLFGYYNLTANLTTYLASHWVSLEAAPIVTTGIAFAIQMLAPFIILTSSSTFWSSSYKKIVAVFLILFVPNASEVWLNSINSQYWLALGAFLILLEDTARISTARAWSFRVLLFLGGMSSPMACYLTPVFLYEGYRSRNRERLIQTGILSFIAVLQLSVILYQAIGQAGAFGNRFSGMSLATLALVAFNRTVLVPIMGTPLGGVFSSFSASISHSNFHILGATAGLLLLGVLVALGFRIKSEWRIKLVASYLLLVILNINTAMEDKNAMIGPHPGQRYFFVPMIMFLFMILTAWQDVRNLFLKGLFLLILVASLTCGIYEFRGSVRASADWPKWRDEVQLWRADPTHDLLIWPPPWFLELSSNEVPE